MPGLVALLLVGGLLPPRATAGGLPPAGTDTLDANAEISVVSLLGAETISLTGTVTIERSDPRSDGGVEVVDAEIVSMDLEGTSLVGPISVTESVTFASIGEIRSLQSGEKFPASSFFDVFINVVVPGSPSPTLTLHNNEAMHLVPMSGGNEVPLTAWPPSDVTYQDEPDPCIPLLPVLPAAVCVTMVSVTFREPQPPTPTPTPTSVGTPQPTSTTTPQPLEGPTLSVAADGPSGRHPADLLGLAPTVTTAFLCLELGLTADGCDDSADGDQDDVNALSFGADFTLGDAVTFSVAAGSAGVLGTTVRSQADCEPAQPQADAFSTSLNGSNVLLFDGDGQVGGCLTATAFGLLEIPDSDDLDALDKHSAAFVDIEGDGESNEAVFFSLATGSSTLASLSRSSADILWTVGGSQPDVYALASVLGLQTDDDIDALCVADDGDAFYEAGIDRLAFSLASGSPTLAALGAGPADLLIAGPQVLVVAAELGLQADDDLNAMMCGPGLVLTPFPTPTPTPTSPAVSPTPTPTTPAVSSTLADTSEVLAVALPKVGTGGTPRMVSDRLPGVLLPGLAAFSGLVLFGLGVRRLRRP
jgi:hypothetical protein